MCTRSPVCKLQKRRVGCSPKASAFTPPPRDPLPPVQAGSGLQIRKLGFQGEVLSACLQLLLTTAELCQLLSDGKDVEFTCFCPGAQGPGSVWWEAVGFCGWSMDVVASCGEGRFRRGPTLRVVHTS